MTTVRTPPAWASLPYARMQATHLPIIAYHRLPPRRVPREYLVRGVISLGLGLAGVLSMVLYEAGLSRTAFVFSVTTATVGAFVSAAQVMAAYNPINFDEPMNNS